MGHVYGWASSGLYCHPSHPRRIPGEVRYPLAASAEAAGLRACRDCRPYRFAQTVGLDAPELVCRAVRLIVAGALDEGSEAALAARLGLSGRHLRRLFLGQLGVTPDGLARSCRAHFARRLLEDTDLPITDLAFAAGYGSGRQFNREFKRAFQATPSQLRADRSAPGLAAEGGLTLRLCFAGPLDWDALLRFLAARTLPGVEQVDGPVYRRTIAADGDSGMLELWPGAPNQLNLGVYLPHWERLLHVAAVARTIASLDDDPARPRESLASDRLIGPLLSARPGVRVPGAWDAFEVGVAAIIEQQKGSAARQVLRQVITTLGRPVPGLGPFGLTHTFPPPAALGAAGAELQAAGLAGDQAATVMAYAAAVERGAIAMDGSMAAGRLIAALAAIPGIASSTAQYVALRTGEPDAFPADDPMLRQTLGDLRAVPAPWQRWRPWRSYAAAQLWAVT